MRPLTDTTPKALLPVGGVPLLDQAIARLRPFVDRIAVNAHWLHEQIADHVRGTDVHVSLEQPEALGTAGALGALRDWVDGANVLVTNADAWFDRGVPDVRGTGIRLLVVEDDGRGDFGARRYAGLCFMPWREVKELQPVPSGLYEVSWRTASLDFVEFDGTFIDCGTPDDYARANTLARRAGT